MKPLKANNFVLKQQLLINKFIGQKFDNLGVIGGGSYGEVYKVRHKQTKKVYAVKIYKKIFTNRILALRTLRQVTILRRINHDQIIKIYDILPPENLDDFQSIGVLLEYQPFDLKRLCQKNKFLKDEHIPKVIYQILIALKYLKQVKILHRDLKPQNILSDNDYNIKICDFGLARPDPTEQKFTELTQIEIEKVSNETNNNQGVGNNSLSPHLPQKPSKLMTCHVVSRWYRAPQLILMQTKYDSSIEMWSVGCILGELISEHEKNKLIQANKQRRALFEGKACFPLSPPKKEYVKLYKVQNGFPHSEDDQISKILQVIGSPTQEQVSFIEEALAANYIKSLPKYQKKKASDIFNYCKPEWQDFLQRSLVFDPRKRMTIDEALMHRLFDGIRKEQDLIFKVEQNFDISLPSDMPLGLIKQKLKQQILYYQNGTVMEEK